MHRVATGLQCIGVTQQLHFQCIKPVGDPMHHSDRRDWNDALGRYRLRRFKVSPLPADMVDRVITTQLQDTPRICHQHLSKELMTYA